MRRLSVVFVATLLTMLPVLATANEAERCNELAAHPSQPDRIGNGVLFFDIKEDAAIAACRSAVADNPSGPNLFRFGRALNAARHFDEALVAYEKAADLGYLPAQNNIALMYLHDFGESQDRDRAVALLEQLAEQGYADAYFSLGWLALYGPDTGRNSRTAADYFEQAANAGSAFGQVYLGYMYEQGMGGRNDPVTAANWYVSANETNPMVAQIELARIYLFGNGVEKRAVVAGPWLIEAAEDGDARTLLNLALMYTDGLGVIEDKVEAQKWYLLALAHAPDDQIDRIRFSQDAVVRRMTSDQLAEAERLAQEWMDAHR